LPEIWARTSCPLGKATRNIVPGSTCVTDPVNSIGSSLATAKSRHTRVPFRAASTFGRFVVPSQKSAQENRKMKLSTHFCKRLLAKNSLESRAETTRLRLPVYDMNQSPLPKILMGMLAFVAALCVYYSIAALRNGRELRQFQTKLAVINQRMPVISALATDLLEYSKKNPAIDPLLESCGFKPGKGPAPAPAPALKPPTK
jgi:hypothetical protein